MSENLENKIKGKVFQKEITQQEFCKDYLREYNKCIDDEYIQKRIRLMFDNVLYYKDQGYKLRFYQKHDGESIYIIES